MSEWLLEFDHVYYTYPAAAQPTLNEVTLRIPKGKRCALIGQNGCGKTTLFLLANGLYKPQQGEIFWKGTPFSYSHSALTQLRQHIGLVFQNPEQQIVATTVEEDISYGLCNLKLPEAAISQRVAQVLADFELTDLATIPVHHLSLGQKKQVSLAGVMVLQPELLLLDEPTAYLDQLHTRQLTAMLRTIQATGTTVVITTHDLNLVYRWADWVFVLDQGKLILEGTPQEVFAQRKRLEELQLGVPIIFELLAELEAMAQSFEFPIDSFRASMLRLFREEE